MTLATPGTFTDEEQRALDAAATAYDAAHPEETSGDQPLPTEPQGLAAAAPAPASAPTPAPSSTPAAAPSPTSAPAAQATPAPSPAPAAAAETPSASPAPAPTQGDLRGALRASRHGERQWRGKAERLERENQELRTKLGQPEPGAAPKLPDSARKDMETYAPEAAAYVADLEARVQQAPAPAPAPAEFTPVLFDPDIQEAIDDVPELAAWQSNPDQTAFKLARTADTLLQRNPAWADKPLPERFAEAVKLAKQHMGMPSAPSPAPTPPAPSPAQVAASVIAAAPLAASGAPAIGAMPAGSPAPFKRDYSKMSDEEVMNSLQE